MHILMSHPISNIIKLFIFFTLYRAPLGAAHFIKLVEDGFYTDIAMYRSVESFLTQFGISDKPQFTLRHRSTIPDDTPKSIPIRQGYLSFAGGGPNSRTTQTFIAYEDLEFLGKEPWETPFGKVPLTESNKIVLKAIHKLGDIAPFGPGPDQTILSA